MRGKQWLVLGVLLGLFGLGLGLHGQAIQQRPAPKNAMTLKGRIMDYSKLTAKDTDKFLQAIGPAIRDLLKRGDTVSVQGLGQFRIVNVPAHRDLVNGRPATIPAASYVEFIPTGDLAAAANGPSATPAEVVPPFQYVPLPGRDPGIRTGNTRMPNVRTR
jgi:nucleoid DNA-binding protein